MFPRSSGILLHLTSLPGDYGIGSMGKEARTFVDFLQKAGERYWQLLPLVPSGKGASPYMSPSSAAGNPLLIDLPTLAEQGLIDPDELKAYRYYDVDRVNYDWVTEVHGDFLHRAYLAATPELLAKVAAYAETEPWLEDYALFQACHDYFDAELIDWPDTALLRREPEALERYRALLGDEIGYYRFIQYEFFTQWHALKRYANERGIQIIGDIPFYVSPDSVDVWVHPEMFRVNRETLRADAIAGVPADLFSATGQLWGNPLYDWDAQAKDGFRWWCERIRRTNAFYDVIRIDHFRGIHSYWEIPAGSEDALSGRWRKGPGQALLDAIQKNVPTADFIAEDLGDITEDVYKFIRNSGLPGLRVLTDAFNDLGGSSSFLPHHCIPGAVMYTGTHDTPTFCQWLFELATDDQRSYAWRYLRLNEQEGIGWGVIAGAWGSVCSLAMAPLQDVLGLGGDARMNAPGTEGPHNWSWRVRMEALNDGVAYRLRELNWLYGRL